MIDFSLVCTLVSTMTFCVFMKKFSLTFSTPELGMQLLTVSTNNYTVYGQDHTMLQKL